MWMSLAPPRPPQARPGHVQQVFSCAPIYDLIFCDLSPRTLVWLSHACRYTHAAVACFYRRAYNINQHLSRFFSDPLSFRSLQARTGLVISGSNALQFFDRTFYPGSDLDLYAHPGHVYELLEWLESVDYQFEPSGHQEEDWHNHVSADWDGTVKRTQQEQAAGGTANALDLSWYPDIAGVYTFKRFAVVDGEFVELKVQVMETTCNPISTIMKFHSTCVMNIITFNAAYSFYPVATFEERAALNIPASKHNPDVIAKYVKRGWRVFGAFRPRDIMRPRASPFFANETRWVGDHRCWSIPLDTSGVKPRPVMSPSSEQFSWDPAIHNGWIMSYSDSSDTGQKVPFMNAHLIMTTIFRYNYIFPDEKLALIIRGWSRSQGNLNHRSLTKPDWTWFDDEIPRFREAVELAWAMEF
ncbi:uncharacterized protein EDB91DRAFT_1334677 [Suillus paluster]|uniref:uncharacterized protein n=1 Tax=Suillus paluster TaxID=48578 RepID=UPI001B878C65|nr:uncharacterized protein EDB91DRAFT_1334677 [Suillus paluster]KAG1748497.1 hypothetical protein EDB91DRAFT_1334677 [Suillus paluster]